MPFRQHKQRKSLNITDGARTPVVETFSQAIYSLGSQFTEQSDSVS
jgi:hypothetical protein